MKIKKPWFFALELIWLGVCVSLLVVYLPSLLDGSDRTENIEMGVAFTLGMLTLTFPIGYPAALIAGLISEILKFSGQNMERLENFALAWILMVMCGYIQWFVLLPKIIRAAISIYQQRVRAHD